MRCWWMGMVLVVGTLLIGCGPPTGDDDDDNDNGSPSPTPEFALEDGTYDYLIHAVPSDTCWAPPKTLPEVPSTMIAEVVVNGDTVTVTPQLDGGITQEFVMTKDGDNLSGISEGDIDLNDSELALDCILHVNGTFDGVMTGDNTFDAVQTVNVAEAGGTACFLLVGNLDPNQVDQLPCAFTLNGTGTKQ